MTKGPIVLLTDFGLRDPFAGIVKGVILSRAPASRIVDLAHEIPPGDVRTAALALRMSAPYFPTGSLFVVVVDPGVGSGRRVVWARSRSSRFLAPDNGVLSWLAEGEEIVEWRQVSNAALFLSPLGGTFHGRDVFAPVAAALFRGFPPAKLGPRLEDPVRLPWPEPRRSRTTLSGAVLSFDRFGNALTNVPNDAVPAGARIVHRGRDLGPLRSHYSAVRPGRALAVAGSAGLVELAKREGDYAAETSARPGDTVHVRYRR